MGQSHSSHYSYSGRSRIDLEKEKVNAALEAEKSRLEVEKIRLELDVQRDMEKSKREAELQKMEKLLEWQVKQEEIKAQLEKEIILHEREHAKRELDLDSIKKKFEVEADLKEQEQDKIVQEMEFQVMNKFLDLGYDPVEFNYAMAGISRTLRNDKSDEDRKYQREIFRHKLALQDKTSFLAASSATVPVDDESVGNDDNEPRRE